jgi:hypothetical protein
MKLSVAGAALLASLRPPASDVELDRIRATMFGWEHWPHDRKLPDDERGANWPERWRAARGFND